MTVRKCGIWGAAGFWALALVVTPALGQENLDQGKSAAQLFASDCAICHKSPNGLGKAGGLFGLDNFLRLHYTASKESATSLAKYLQAFANAPEPGTRKKRSAKSTDKSKDKEKSGKPAQAKSSKDKDAKPAEAKSAPKDEPKKEMKETPKQEPKSEAKSEAKPKAESKPESKPEKSDRPN